MEIMHSFINSYPEYPHLDKPLCCSLCGHTGDDVRIFYKHFGGFSVDQPVPECINIRECWRRYDKQHRK